SPPGGPVVRQSAEYWDASMEPLSTTAKTDFGAIAAGASTDRISRRGKYFIVIFIVTRPGIKSNSSDSAPYLVYYNSLKLCSKAHPRARMRLFYWSVVWFSTSEVIDHGNN